MKKIVFTGGGTAGHIYPNLAIALEMPNWQKFYIGSFGMEEEVLKGYKDIKFFKIDTVKFDRVKLSKNFLIPFKLHKSVKEAKKILTEIKPDIIFSKGGFVALPVALAAKKLGINVITHESDLSMGLANKIISLSAKKVCTTFPQCCKKSDKYVCTGQPIRRQIFEGNKANILPKLNFPTKPIILFVGGSLGAVKINNLLKNPKYLTDKFCVVHSVGKNNFSSVKSFPGYFPFPYLNNIADFYDAADLVVTRAGSGAISELLALKKPMLLLPLSKSASRGDQIENAKLFTSLGYGEMILDENLDEDNLLKIIKKMMQNLDFYKKNLQNAEKNEAVQKIIALIEEFS